MCRFIARSAADPRRPCPCLSCPALLHSFSSKSSWRWVFFLFLLIWPMLMDIFLIWMPILAERPEVKGQFTTILYQLLLDPSERVCFEAISCVLGKFDASERYVLNSGPRESIVYVFWGLQLRRVLIIACICAALKTVQMVGVCSQLLFSNFPSLPQCQLRMLVEQQRMVLPRMEYHQEGQKIVKPQGHGGLNLWLS